jgi:small subunit ribosomal protein S27Ae
MYIQVSTISGRTETIFANSLAELQLGIQNQMGINIDEQKILCNGKLATDENLSESVQLVISLEGGAKGKKKKATAKKAKKKHKHRKEKLRVLNFYKVDGEKVVRLKRMCDVCPPGTFLAEHEDRLYCGRCRSAYTKADAKDKPQKQKKKQPKAEKPKVEEPKEAPKKGKKGKK